MSTVLPLLLFGTLAVRAAPMPWTEPPPDSGGEADGQARLTPSSFVVDRKHTLVWVYEVGPEGLAAGDAVRVEDPIFRGVRWSRWSLLTTDPEACTPHDPSGSTARVDVEVSGDATVRLVRSDATFPTAPYAYTDLLVEAGQLVEGDSVRILFGDTTDGAVCGLQMPDRAFKQVRIRAFEWRDSDGTFTQIRPSPTFDLVSRPTPTWLHLGAPSIVVAGEPFEVHTAVLDDLGNPMDEYEGTVTVEQVGSVTLTTTDRARHAFTTTLSEPGIHRLTGSAGDLEAVSNPIRVVEEPPDERVYWGDLHTHFGHTRTDPDGERIDENHDYGRHVLGYDFGAETPKAAPYTLDADRVWTELTDICARYTADGEYVAFLGFEWMGNVATENDGHHNVYFDSCDGENGEHVEGAGIDDPEGLWDFVRRLEEERGTRAITIAHATLHTGHNWEARDDTLRTTAEVYSAWGDSLATEEPVLVGDVARGLAMGHRMGILASSDNHSGWLGNRYAPGRHAQGGLAAIRAPALTREDLFEALRDKRTYGTTGVKILLDAGLVDGDVAIPMGTEADVKAPELTWAASGTERIEAVRWRGVPLDVAEDEAVEVQTLHEAWPDALDTEGQVALDGWDGTPMVLWLEIEQIDGERAWSSPFWIHPAESGEETGTETPRTCGCSGGGRAAMLPLLLLLVARRRSPLTR